MSILQHQNHYLNVGKWLLVEYSANYSSLNNLRLFYSSFSCGNCISSKKSLLVSKKASRNRERAETSRPLPRAIFLNVFSLRVFGSLWYLVVEGLMCWYNVVVSNWASSEINDSLVEQRQNATTLLCSKHSLDLLSSA